MGQKIFGGSWTLLALLACVSSSFAQNAEQGAAKPAEGTLRREEAGFRGIYQMQRDGTQAEFLTAAPDMIANSDPQMSHDGRMVAFGGMPSFDAMVESKMFVAAIAGPFKGCIRDLGYGNTPTWSPDDRQIAYMINYGNPAGVEGGAWVMNADGTHRERVAAGWFPRFSPNGEQLICQGILNGEAQDLLLVNLDDKNTTPLLKKHDWQLKMYGGNWSPDGKEVVFVGEWEGKDRVASVNVKDETIRILYSNDNGSQELFGPPAWSPDGRQIVFVGQDTESGPRRWWNSYLYSISTDSPEQAKLLEGKKVGNINRGMAFSPDSSKVLFSSER